MDIFKVISQKANFEKADFFIGWTFVNIFFWSSSIYKLNLIKKLVNKPIKYIIIAISYLIIFNYIFLVCYNAVNSNFFDHAEPTISSVSWLFQKGQPLYHGLESAERYSLLYGPMLYIINGFFLSLLGPSIFATKFAGTLGALINLVLIFWILKNFLDYQTSIVYLAYITLLFILGNSGYVTASFWGRSDPLIMMFVSLALLGVTSRINPLIVVLLCALSLGISLNLKIHAILYYLPIYVLLWRRHGIRYTVCSILISILIVIAPFVFYPQVSLNNYILWLREASQHGVSISALLQNLNYTIYLSAPIIIISAYLLIIARSKFQQCIHQNISYIYSLIISLVVCTILASKYGAGMNHLLPFIPLFSYLFILLFVNNINAIQKNFSQEESKKHFYNTIGSIILTLLILSVISSFINESSIIYTLGEPSTRVINDINKIVKSYPDTTIEMGYSDKGYKYTFFRPILVFAGNPYLIDVVSLMDMQKSGLTIPAQTLEELDLCRPKLWLIPKGAVPFEIGSYYPPNVQLFDDNFKTIFRNKYEFRGQTEYFDLWFCKLDNK